MKIKFHKYFEKKYQKLPQKIKSKVKERLNIFLQDPFATILNNHALTGNYSGYRSVNVTGDIRMIYKLENDSLAVFVTIGSHSELYS